MYLNFRECVSTKHDIHLHHFYKALQLSCKCKWKKKKESAITRKYAPHISMSLHPIFLTSSSNMTTHFTTVGNKSGPSSICLQTGGFLHLDAGVHGQLWLLFTVTNPFLVHAVAQPAEDFIDKCTHKSGCWCFTGRHLLSLHPSPLWSTVGDLQINCVWGLVTVSKDKIRSVCTCQPHEIWNCQFLLAVG